MINKRFKYGNYFYVWSDSDCKFLQITQLQNNVAKKQIGFLFLPNETKISYFDFSETPSASNKILISKDCVLANDLAKLIRSIQDENNFNAQIASNSTVLDMAREKYYLRFCFTTHNPQQNFVKTNKYNAIFNNFFNSCFQKLETKNKQPPMEY